MQEPSLEINRLIRLPAFQAAILATAYTLFASLVSLWMHHSYATTALDLGLFAQCLNSALHGDLFYNTAEGMSHFGYHFQPIMFLLVPIFWLAPYCETLLIIQSLALGASCYLVYRLARTQGLSHRKALLVEILFSISPMVWGVNFFDFHPVSLAVPALLIMFLGLLQKRWKLFSCGLVLALITKEDVIAALGVFGLVMIIHHYLAHRKIARAYLAILLASLATFGIAVATAKVTSGLSLPPMLMQGGLRYPYINEPIWQAIHHALIALFTPSSIYLFFAYFLPLGFLPLFSPLQLAPALFILAMNMLSTKPEQHRLLQYPAPAIAFVFLALTSTLARMEREGRAQLLLQKAWRPLLIIMVLTAVLTNVNPQSVVWDRGYRGISLPSSHKEAITRVTALIPSGATVTAPNHIFPHICPRTVTYLPPWPEPTTPNGLYGHFGIPENDTSYVVIDGQHKEPYPEGGWWEDEIRDDLEARYVLVARIEDVSLYKLAVSS